MTELTKKIIEVIKSIPKGKVMTYGQVAMKAGNPRASRQVSRVLYNMSEKHNLPWHRVINSKGEISLKNEGFEIQKRLLESEGVEFISQNKVDMNKFKSD